MGNHFTKKEIEYFQNKMLRRIVYLFIAKVILILFLASVFMYGIFKLGFYKVT